MISHESYGFIKINSANANDFAYEFYIISISPTVGRKAGGTVINL